MKGRSILLYALGLCFFIIGNRDLWDELQEDWEKEANNEKRIAQAKEAAAKPFETQVLTFDKEKKEWKNPSFSFQIVHAGSNINFKALNRSKKTMVELHDDEDATDSN